MGIILQKLNKLQSGWLSLSLINVKGTIIEITYLYIMVVSFKQTTTKFWVVYNAYFLLTAKLAYIFLHRSRYIDCITTAM